MENKEFQQNSTHIPQAHESHFSCNWDHAHQQKCVDESYDSTRQTGNKSMARSIRQGESNNVNNKEVAPLIILRNITSRFLSGMWIFKILHRNLHTLRCTCSQRSTKACNNLSHPSSSSVKPQTRHQMQFEPSNEPTCLFMCPTQSECNHLQ